MKRRDLLLLATGAAITRNPASAETDTPRIGFVQLGSRQDNQGLLDAFRENLAALGWSDGSNIAVVGRWAEEHTEQLPGIVKELIGSGVAVLVTGGTPAPPAPHRAGGTLPILLVGVGGPLAPRGGAELAETPGNSPGLALP